MDIKKNKKWKVGWRLRWRKESYSESVFSIVGLSLYRCLHDTRHGEIGVIVLGVSYEVKGPCVETKSNCPSFCLSFFVTWYQGLNGLSDLLKFDSESIYRKSLFRILLLSSECILITRNKLKGINCTLQAKYIIHTKETGKSLIYLALFRKMKIRVEFKRNVTDIQSFKTEVNTFLHGLFCFQLYY
jgi:hypothetical protein